MKRIEIENLRLQVEGGRLEVLAPARYRRRQGYDPFERDTSGNLAETKRREIAGSKKPGFQELFLSSRARLMSFFLTISLFRGLR